jgi:glutamate synthase domain-containing protein 1
MSHVPVLDRTWGITTYVHDVFLTPQCVQDEGKRNTAKQAIEAVAKSNKFNVLGWRLVPVKPDVLGKLALENSPWVEQIVLQSDSLTGDDLEQALYGVQRSVQTAVFFPHLPIFSLSCLSQARLFLFSVCISFLCLSP